MHVNNRKPNILQDKRAHAQGADLRNKDRFGNPSAKRWNTPPKKYPYQSKRQAERRNAK